MSQLLERGLIPPGEDKPAPPWHRVRGTEDATTLWYAVMRKEIKEGVHIGALCIRHSDHHASLLGEGYQEVEPSEIGEVQPGPWSPGYRIQDV